MIFGGWLLRPETLAQGHYNLGLALPSREPSLAGPY